jgi:hypothetical protein
MYGFEPGEGQFWRVGRLTTDHTGRVRIVVSQAGDAWLERRMWVNRRTWLGELALMPVGRAREVPLAEACGRYVDRFRVGGAQR